MPIWVAPRSHVLSLSVSRSLRGMYVKGHRSSFYSIIAIHDVPYEIAHRRDHPHQDAIHAAGWVSLFTLHALWPFLWIWAMLYRPERGWGFQHGAADSNDPALDDLVRRVRDLEARAKLDELPPKRPEFSATSPLETDAKR